MLKKLLIPLIILIILIVMYISITLISIVSFDSAIKEENLLTKDYIIVLGSRVYGDMPGPKLTERLDYTLSLIPKTNAKIIVSGGQGADEDFHEAIIMKKYLVEKGVDQERILLEDKATSTWENLNYSKTLLEKENPKVLVISSDYHMFRVNMLIKRMGLEWDVSGSVTKDKFEAVKREIVAVLKSFIFDR